MRIASLVALLAALVACDSTAPIQAGLNTDFDPYQLEPIPLDSLSQDASALIGTWQWVASVNYFTPNGPTLRTPESADRTQSWTFSADGRATYREDGEVVRATTYEVTRRTYGNGTTETRPSLRLGEGYGNDFGIRGDLLVLDSTPVDGPQERYRRK